MKHKYMTITEWKKREFFSKAWDNRTIKKYIGEGKIIGILNGNATLIRSDQALEKLSNHSTEINELIRLSA